MSSILTLFLITVFFIIGLTVLLYVAYGGYQTNTQVNTTSKQVEQVHQQLLKPPQPRVFIYLPNGSVIEK